MKIIIMGEEKGMFKNVSKWINDYTEHSCVQWGKFYPKGNKNECLPCPITDPDIILMLSNYVTYEDLPYMGITTEPCRVYFSLGNKDVSPIVRDWRMSVFNDEYVSYNPNHKDYQIYKTPNKFQNLKLLPLPFDITGFNKIDTTNMELSVSQSLSNMVMMGGYSKNTTLIARACKQAGIELELLFDLSEQEHMNRRAQHPVSFDNMMGMFGATTLEAMSIGQISICSLHDGIAEAYEQLLGAPLPIIIANNQDELIEVLSKMKSGEINWKAKCEESYQFMQNYFSPQKIAQVYTDTFNGFLGG